MTRSTYLSPLFELEGLCKAYLSTPQARKLYEVASAAGHGWATYNLAVMLNQGLGGPSLPSKAHSLLLQAAEMGVKEAKDALLVLEEEKQQQMVSLEGMHIIFRYIKCAYFQDQFWKKYFCILKVYYN